MAENRPPNSSQIGKINCPDCGPRQPARLLIRDDSGRPMVVYCLQCEQAFPAEKVGWQD